MNLAQEAWERNDVIRAKELLERHDPAINETDMRGIEWYFLRRLCEESSSIEKRIFLPYGARGLALSPSKDKFVVGLQNNSITIVDPRKGRVLQKFGPGDRTWLPTYVEFSNNGTQLIVPANDTRNIQVLKWPSCQVLMEMRGHTEEVRAASAAPNDPVLASASANGEIIIWDLDSGSIVHREPAHTGKILSLDFSHNSPRLVSGGDDGTVKLWRWTGTALEIEKQHDDHLRGISAAAFSNAGRLIASGGVKEIILWDTIQNKRLFTLDGHADELRTLEFSSDDKSLLSASRDKSVKLWDVETGTLLMTKKVHSSVATSALFLNDETVASIGFDGTLAIWPIDHLIHTEHKSPKFRSMRRDTRTDCDGLTGI